MSKKEPSEKAILKVPNILESPQNSSSSKHSVEKYTVLLLD